jgi:hypothetical protein
VRGDLRAAVRRHPDSAAPCSGQGVPAAGGCPRRWPLGHGGRERLPTRSEEPVEEMEQGDGGGRGAARLGFKVQMMYYDMVDCHEFLGIFLN